MGRPPLAHAVLVTGLLLPAATFSIADDLPDCGGFPVYLTVTPAQPDCTDTVTLGATQVLTDSCWTATPPVFLDESPDYEFQLASIDEWEPGRGCLPVLLEIPFTRQVGPLPAGPYSLAVTHSSTSQRQGDSACSDWIPFDVTCCDELPAEATSLQVGKVSADTEIWLNWIDVAGAKEYVVFGDDKPDGPFTRPIQTAPRGTVGVGIPIDVAPSFFLIGARNDCGVGPRH